MMRLELFVDDKKLAPLLHAIDGMVVQMTIGPVHNAVNKAGKVAEAGQPTSGREVVMKVISAAAAEGHTTVTTGEFVEAAKQYGISKLRVSSALGLMKKEKLVKSQSRGNYLINTGATNA